MFKIGDIEIKNRIVLAPMAGITSLGYRKFMSQFNLGYVVTEMVSDMGLIYGNEETKTYVNFKKSELPTCVQLFGSNPETLAKASKIALELNPNIVFFDINMGCPVKKVTSTGAGSSLLNNPKLCGEIVKAVKEASGLSVTVKIRLGFDKDHNTFKEVIKEVTNAGCDLVTIHPRTAKEMYGGTPHWDLVKDLRKEMSIPLLVSGNIYSVEDAIKAMEITGADGVMLARGAVGNPLLVKNLNHYFNNEDMESTCFNEQVEYCKELVKDLIEEKGEDVAMRVSRGIVTKFFDGFKNSKKLKNRLSTELVKYSDLEKIISDYIEENCV